MKVKLKEIADVIAGQSPASKYYSDCDGFPFLQGNRTFGDRYPLIDSFTSKITKAADAGDVLISVRAPVGDINIAPCDLCIGRGLAAIKAKDGDNAFLYYALKQNVRTLTKRGNGTTYDSVDADTLQNLDLLIPEKEDLRAYIARLLNTLDDSIENNSSICSDLEATAKLLYDYWFVQFDFPDENGKPYKSSGGKMVWNDELKREIPAGWKVVTLAECISIKKSGDWGSAEQQKADDIKVNCIRGADFPAVLDEYALTAPARYIRSKKSGCLLSDGDLVTEISGGSPTQSTGRICYVNQGLLDRSASCVTCSNFCLAFTPRDLNEQFWLYQTWKAHYDADIMFNFESKTTGLKNLMFDDFTSSVRVPHPPTRLMRKYQLVASGLYDLVQTSFKESASLAALRDFLLPLLMNGQVTIGDDDK